MGNPVITRLGLNQFWYKHWYSDTLRNLSTRQDCTLETLVSIYLKYGLSFQNNILFHEYWYKPNYRPVRTKFRSYEVGLFFRRFYYRNDALTIEHTYLLRTSTVEYFPMKSWIMRYNNWLIFSVQWFKPAKVKHVVTSRNSRMLQVAGIWKSISPPSNRLKLYMLFLKQAVLSPEKNYNF
jgi:hypothetical protein